MGPRPLVPGLLCSLAAICAACTPLAPNDARPARSTVSCARSVLTNKLPESIPDDTAHCLAAGFIARYCSVSEAYIAGLGKELEDSVGHGDAQWRDWQADRRGIACAKRASSDDDVYACCGWQPRD
ncbi:MAG: hypothetical protein ABW110_10520 [Steroidobacteraceae bacterium]